MTADTRVLPDRRASGARFHYPERRTGFDRRVPARSRLDRLVLRLRNSDDAVFSVAAAIAVLNVLDLLLTLAALDRGIGEANPVMAGLFEANVWLAATFKLVMGTGAAALVWTARRYKRVLQAGLFLLTVFVAVTLYHFVGLIILGL